LSSASCVINVDLLMQLALIKMTIPSVQGEPSLYCAFGLTLHKLRSYRVPAESLHACKLLLSAVSSISASKF